MRCVIPKAHLKIFARAVHSLAKIGDDLYLDAGESGLAISTINSSRSAYARIFPTGVNSCWKFGTPWGGVPKVL